MPCGCALATKREFYESDISHSSMREAIPSLDICVAIWNRSIQVSVVAPTKTQHVSAFSQGDDRVVDSLSFVLNPIGCLSSVKSSEPIVRSSKAVTTAATKLVIGQSSVSVPGSTNETTAVDRGSLLDLLAIAFFVKKFEYIHVIV
jgi:hypothetical protein